MEISFGDAKLHKLCNDGKKLRAKFGDQMANVIGQRLADLEAVDTLEEMRKLPGRCHELSGNFKRHLALDLRGGDRLVFRPSNKPVPRNSSGALEWPKVTAIEVIGIGDYH